MAPLPSHVTTMRARYRDVVLAGRVRIDQRWAQRCQAFNLQAELEPATRAAFALVQAGIAPQETALLAVPGVALHLSIDWLLGVDHEHRDAKPALWEQHGEEWIEQLAAIAARCEPFVLAYRWLVVTDTAIIAVAEQSEALQRLRKDIRQRIVVPGEARPMASIAHTTLFRFGGPLTDPVRLLRTVGEIELDARTAVREVVLSEELVYPSLTTRVHARLALERQMSTWID